MNNARRKQLELVQVKISFLIEKVEEIRGELESIRDDEQEYRDNMPDSLADGDKGQRADEAIAALEELISEFEDFEGVDFDGQLSAVME